MEKNYMESIMDSCRKSNSKFKPGDLVYVLNETENMPDYFQGVPLYPWKDNNPWEQDFIVFIKVRTPVLYIQPCRKKDVSYSVILHYGKLYSIWNTYLCPA